MYEIAPIFRVSHAPVDSFLTYLGFRMNPNTCLNSDWQWLMDIFGRKINNWTHKWLSHGDRLVLVKSLLQNIPIYWMHLFRFPREIISRIDAIIAKFIWLCVTEGKKIHLVNIDKFYPGG